LGVVDTSLYEIEDIYATLSAPLQPLPLTSTLSCWLEKVDDQNREFRQQKLRGKEDSRSFYVARRPGIRTNYYIIV
jgi:hypothetical protein